MIAALYNSQVMEKARAIAAAADELPSAERDAFCQNYCGLTYSYLRRVGKDFKKPSARVLMNLGYEVYVKDLDTGEMSRLELDVACDWNPSNPRLNPSSTPVSLPELSEASSGSE